MSEMRSFKSFGMYGKSIFFAGMIGGGILDSVAEVFRKSFSEVSFSLFAISFQILIIDSALDFIFF